MYASDICLLSEHASIFFSYYGAYNTDCTEQQMFYVTGVLKC